MSRKNTRKQPPRKAKTPKGNIDYVPDIEVPDIEPEPQPEPAPQPEPEPAPKIEKPTKKKAFYLLTPVEQFRARIEFLERCIRSLVRMHQHWPIEGLPEILEFLAQASDDLLKLEIPEGFSPPAKKVGSVPVSVGSVVRIRSKYKRQYEEMELTGKLTVTKLLSKGLVVRDEAELCLIIKPNHVEAL